MGKRRQTRKKQRKQKTQKGGFPVSIAGGIGNAVYLAPLCIRAGMKLLKSRKTYRKQRK
jgi:hypothetical protein